MGVPFVISKAVTAQHGKVLEKIGCDRVVYPEGEMGLRVARSLVSPTILDELEISQEYGIFEMQVPKIFVGKTLAQVEFRSRFGLNVIAIKENSGEININPGGDDILEEKQILVLLGKKEDLLKMEKAIKKLEK